MIDIKGLRPTILNMDFVFKHQYELLYSFGAMFAFFSMLSYVAPTVQSSIARRDNTSMDNSDQFFEGFDGPDLASIMSPDFDEDEEDDEGDDSNVLSLNEKTGGFSND
ncbi:MAG: hypothetical protein ACRBBP_05245 [Bdellovibrionales bacterium]